MNRGTWARQLASALGNSNPSADTIRFIAAWTKCEDTRARFNPLASSHKTPGDSSFNGIVRNYPDAETGIRMTVETLNGRHNGYSDIRQGIMSNNPEQSLRGLYVSPWGTSGLCVDLKYHGSVGIEDEPLKSFPTGDEMADTLEDYFKDNPGVDLRHDTPGDIASNVVNDPLGSALDYSGLDTNQYGRRVAYVAGGVVLLAIGIVLAVRSLVPTQQIVKTIAEVA